MDIMDYETNPDLIAALRNEIDKNRDDLPTTLRNNVATVMDAYFVTSGIGNERRARYSARKTRLPAWMKDPNLLPKKPPHRRIVDAS